MKLFFTLSFCFSCLITLFAQSDSILFADKVWAGDFVIEPPTLHCAGFEWQIRGDANRNATVEVKYRKLGMEDWSNALPLLRIGGEKIYGHGQRWIYETPPLFAGSIFNLEDDSEYECSFTLTDPDGVLGEAATQRVVIKTRKEPKAYSHGNTYHVYPIGYEGSKLEPAFTGLNEAYYGGGNGGDWWLVPEPRVQPGDIILVHGGLYQGDLLNYVDPLALNFHGAYVFTQKGTPEKPIAIKAAGDGEVIFDGSGAYRLFDVMAADYHLFEGITIRNTQIAFYAGLKHVKGCSGLSVKHCKIEDVGIAVMTHSEESKNFYIADNHMTGRHDPDTLHGWYGFEEPTPLSSYYAVKVYGQGHVICHNTISFFHDGICVDTHGLPEKKQDKKCVSIDIYRNDIFNMSDDFIETDGGVHNIRVFENRGFNSYHAGLSAQPMFGGPAYFIRNILYQVPGTTLKFTIRPSGLLVYHNTFCTNTSFVSAANVHFRNNLFMSPNPQRAWSGTFLTGYSSMDYNGYHNDQAGFRWRIPDQAALNNGDESELTWQEAADLKMFHKMTGWEMHGISVDYSIFRNVIPPDPAKKGYVYPVGDTDFRLTQGSKAIDAGVILFNINDDFDGQAPDLGAWEFGSPEVIYGQRN